MISLYGKSSIHLQTMHEDREVHRWLKTALVLIAFRISDPFKLSSFLSLNRIIRRTLRKGIDSPVNRDQYAVLNQAIAKLTNIGSSTGLYYVTVDNKSIAADYIAVWLWTSYFKDVSEIKQNKIEKARIEKGKRRSTSENLKWKSRLWKGLFQAIWNQKESVIFCLLFSQLLSSYLVPRHHKSRRLLPIGLKRYFLNAIWINYSLGRKGFRVKWIGLVKGYVKHYIFLLFVLLVKTFAGDLWNKLKNDQNKEQLSLMERIQNFGTTFSLYLLKAIPRALIASNFVYAPNLFAMFFFTVSAPYLMQLRAYLRGTAWIPLYKLLLDSYVGMVALLSAAAAMYTNSIGLSPRWLVRACGLGSRDSRDATKVSRENMNIINDVFFRMILLAKYKILKVKYQEYSMRRINWKTYDTILMCAGVFANMNLNDYIKKNLRHTADGQFWVQLQHSKLSNWLEHLM